MVDYLTISKNDTFRKKIKITNYFDENISLNVIIFKDNNTFRSGHKLKPEQLKTIIEI